MCRVYHLPPQLFYCKNIVIFSPYEDWLLMIIITHVQHILRCSHSRVLCARPTYLYLRFEMTRAGLSVLRAAQFFGVPPGVLTQIFLLQCFSKLLSLLLLFFCSSRNQTKHTFSNVWTMKFFTSLEREPLPPPPHTTHSSMDWHNKYTRRTLSSRLARAARFLPCVTAVQIASRTTPPTDTTIPNIPRYKESISLRAIRSKASRRQTGRPSMFPFSNLILNTWNLHCISINNKFIRFKLNFPLKFDWKKIQEKRI